MWKFLVPTLKIALLLFVSSLKAKTPAPGNFGSGTKAYCATTLKQMSLQQRRDIVSSYYPSVAPGKNEETLVTPQDMPEIYSAFSATGKTMPDHKRQFLDNLLWLQSERTVSPDLSALGDPALARWASGGIPLKHYTGDMLFSSPTASARLNVKVQDPRSVLEPKDLSKLPRIISHGSITLYIEDRRNSLTLDEFSSWAQNIIAQSQYDKLKDKTADGTIHKNDQSFKVEKMSTLPGVTQYALKIRNLNMGNARTLWLIENIQKSLAPDMFKENPSPAQFVASDLQPMQKTPIPIDDDFSWLSNNDGTDFFDDPTPVTREPERRSRSGNRDRQRPN